MAHPLPVIDKVFRCTLRWTTGPQSAVNVIHIHGDSGTPTPADVFAALDANVDTGLWNTVVPGAVITQVDILPLDGVSGTTSFATGGPAKWSGNSAGDSIPAVAVLVKFGTGLRGPKHRGRIYLPFTSEGTVAGGNITTGQAAALGAQWQELQDDLNANTPPFSIVIASYKHADFAKVTSFVGELECGTQRRRQQRLR